MAIAQARIPTAIRGFAIQVKPINTIDTIKEHNKHGSPIFIYVIIHDSDNILEEIYCVGFGEICLPDDQVHVCCDDLQCQETKYGHECLN